MIYAKIIHFKFIQFMLSNKSNTVDFFFYIYQTLIDILNSMGTSTLELLKS